MANAAFHSRIERIQKAHAQAAPPKKANFRTPGMAGVAAAQRLRRRRNPIKDHLVAMSFGVVLGCLIAVGLMGLPQDGSAWGEGTRWHGLAYYVTMGGLAAAPVLMLLSMVLASRRPGFALFSLGYLSGIVIPLFI